MKMWLVGAGYWGQKLLATLKEFDVDAQVIDIRNGETIDDINNLAPVMLATPLWQHYDQCRTLLSRGHDVYVEKPMAETLQQILKLRLLCRPDQLVMVGHIFQHHPHRNEIKNLINTGCIGEITHVSSRRLNWGIYQIRTDPVLSLGTHDISIVMDLIGSTDTVVHQSRAYYITKAEKPDRVQWSGHCGNATFDCDVSWCWPVRVRETVVMGTKGQIVWNQDNDTYTVTHHHITKNKAVIDPESQTTGYQSQLSPLGHEVQHWVECLRVRKQPSTGFDAALAVAQVIDQIHTLQSL